jgi:hypothetical protein
VLSSWHEHHQGSGDVAIELPTGAGKTLVGGTIGEFRRRTSRERVAYLCPTRQLAGHTAKLLTSYGIPNVLLIGPAASWNAADRARYTGAQAVAVSVYHHVFNSNPALDDAQVLLLDDAHAAEQAVAGPWSVRIDRDDVAYHDVLSLLVDALDPLVVDRLRAENPEGRFQSYTYLASPLGISARVSELEAALETAATTGGISRSAMYALKQVRGRLDRCLVYVSRRSLLFRPLVTPTAVHAAFDAPRQRLYMSATLGAGGELERSFGRRRIGRIPAPKGWDKQGTGRRFYCFPEITTDLSRAPDEVPAWVRGLVAKHGRAIILTPDDRTANRIRETIVPAGVPVLGSEDVEDDLTVFTSKPRAVLLLTNRYDGIDLPNDDCRLVVIAGLPARGDLQERFLHSTLGALEVLEERMRARFVQGAGRATRNAKDYATVLVLGDELLNYITKQEVQAALYPEAQAELAFGYEESLNNSSDGLLEDLDEFTAQTAAWADANRSIVADRETHTIVPPLGTERLAKAAKHEVLAWQAVWQGEWDRALEAARLVLDALQGEPRVQRYAALWNYLASCWARRLADQTGDSDLRIQADRYFGAARAAGRGTTWLDHLAAPADDRSPTSQKPEIDEIDRTAIDAIAATFQRINRSFDATITAARSGLAGREAGAFEEGLVVLGRLCGATSEPESGGTAAPDAAWRFGECCWVSWEAKSEANPDGELAVNDVRQAGSHLRYMSQQHNQAIPTGSISFIVTPQATTHPTARAVAEAHLHQLRPQDVLDLFDRLVRAWRSIRSTGSSFGQTFAALRTEEALPSQWSLKLTSNPVAPQPDDQ